MASDTKYRELKDRTEKEQCKVYREGKVAIINVDDVVVGDKVLLQSGDKIPADGVYGPATQAAVTEFQKIFHLPQTGSVDFAVWYEISNVFVAVSGMA